MPQIVSRKREADARRYSNKHFVTVPLALRYLTPYNSIRTDQPTNVGREPNHYPIDRSQLDLQEKPVNRFKTDQRLDLQYALTMRLALNSFKHF